MIVLTEQGGKTTVTTTLRVAAGARRRAQDPYGERPRDTGGARRHAAGDDRGAIAHFPSAFVFHRFQARPTSPGSLLVMMSPSSGAR
jgi:hypothetical protein